VISAANLGTTLVVCSFALNEYVGTRFGSRKSSSDSLLIALAKICWDAARLSHGSSSLEIRAPQSRAQPARVAVGVLSSS
jgi:hypothetical protein